MSRTKAQQKAWEQRRDGEHQRSHEPGFDGRRYGNKRRAVAAMKVKDRRRTKRAGKRALAEGETPIKRKFSLA